MSKLFSRDQNKNVITEYLEKKMTGYNIIQQNFSLDLDKIFRYYAEHKSSFHLEDWENDEYYKSKYNLDSTILHLIGEFCACKHVNNMRALYKIYTTSIDATKTNNYCKLDQNTLTHYVDPLGLEDYLKALLNIREFFLHDKYSYLKLMSERCFDMVIQERLAPLNDRFKNYFEEKYEFCRSLNPNPSIHDEPPKLYLDVNKSWYNGDIYTLFPETFHTSDDLICETVAKKIIEIESMICNFNDYIKQYNQEDNELGGTDYYNFVKKYLNSRFTILEQKIITPVILDKNYVLYEIIKFVFK